MSQTKKLEQVLDLLLSEDQERAAEILHQIIVEKARTIYESIVDEETVNDDDTDDLDEAEEFGSEPGEDFTNEISSDEDEISADEENDGEVDDDGSDETENSEEEIEDRVEDLESQLADLRAEFDALMGEELQEPNHADLADTIDGSEADADDEMGVNMDSDKETASMFEKAKKPKLEKAPMAKDAKQGKKVDEETQFLSKVADTGQRGTAKLAGTGNKSSLGAEQNQSPYTRAPNKKDYGGTPVKIGSGTGGEYGKYHGETSEDNTVTDNVGLEPKKISVKADTTAKYTGGKAAGDGGSKSPLSKKPA